ncbi:MAG: site-specific DNA-methyltransferase [Anaerolineales bacterium]|nr:site-specific DNA-methyltransferase [Anaerolineales bacterium]
MEKNGQQLPMLDTSQPNPPMPLIHDSYVSGAQVTVFHGDCLELLAQIHASGDKAELIVTSPPYNVGKEYEQVTSLKEYVNAQKATIEACSEILSDTGSICWQVGHYISGSGRTKEAFPLDLVLYPVFKDLGFILKNRIVWHFGHGLHETVRFSGRHETILWFTKANPDYTFNLDNVRVPQKYPGKRHYQGKNKGQISGNPKGKNPNDVWDIPNVKSNHIEKTEHPCQFPVGLVERLILALTNEHDLVVDPYLGVGTTSAAAMLHNRRSAGADTDEGYLDIATDRIRKAASGELKTRPMNKPVYKPDTKSKLAKLPDEWLKLDS